MTARQNESHAEPKTDKTKETFKGKMIRWAIALVLCMAVYKFVVGMQAEQKQEFFATSQAQAVGSCGADNECRAKVANFFDQCIKGNYTSYRSGKYNRKYRFDLEGFNKCLSGKP